MRNRLHVGPVSPTGGGCGTINGPSSQNTAGPATGNGTTPALPLATSTPAALPTHANGLQHQQQQQQFTSATCALSASPPAGPSAFSASIPIGGGHKLHKPTYSNQTVTGCGSAIVPIVSPRNTSIPHPLPPHVSTKASGN